MLHFVQHDKRVDRESNVVICYISIRNPCPTNVIQAGAFRNPKSPPVPAEILRQPEVVVAVARLILKDQPAAYLVELGVYHVAVVVI